MSILYFKIYIKIDCFYFHHKNSLLNETIMHSMLLRVNEQVLPVFQNSTILQTCL